MILTIENVSKSYGSDRVLEDVSFSLETGERVALMGPSGSGKSTLLNCIAGLDRADSGQILFGDVNIRDLDEKVLCELRRKRVSTVFQFFHLLPTLSAAENILLPMQLAGWTEKKARARLGELLEEVGLEQRSHARPYELSGGEMQRVAIARALAVRPEIILADEPTGNLDSQTGDSILDLLESVSESHGCAMLLVTHSERVTRICSRTLKMKDGRVSHAKASA